MENKVYGATNQRSYDGRMKAVGKKAETVILEWLQRFPEVIEVDDWRELRAGQRADVDCAIYYRNGNVVLAEIKSDQYIRKNGNVLVEFLRINHTCDPDFAFALGWTARTPAKFIIYYNPTENSVYIFRADLLRNIVQKFTSRKRPDKAAWLSEMSQMQMRWISTDAIKSTLVFCLPLSEFPAGSVQYFELGGQT